jgi:chromosome partitioning protein
MGPNGKRPSLAVTAQEAGHAVCILETDRQATVSQWAHARHGKPPEVAQVTADKIQAVIGRLKEIA